MRKNNFFGLLAMIMGFGFLITISCSKDDGCVNRTYYLDKDKDNYGSGEGITSCAPPATTTGQYVLKNGDANDENANIGPECTLALYIDDDGDGYVNPEPFYFCVNPDESLYTEDNSLIDCDDNDTSINADVVINFYPDIDNDGYGDPNEMAISQQACDAAPDGYVANADDCDDTDPNRNPGAEQITYYSDFDEDGYGFDEEYQIKDACDPPPVASYALIGGDCDDDNPNINPGATEFSDTDGIDEDCDGTVEPIVWAGSSMTFEKPENADWSNPMYMDQLTENILLTRHDSGFITNLDFWFHQAGGQIPQQDDLEWEYFGRQSTVQPVANVGEAEPSGGPHGIRWAILEKGGETAAWDNFDWYGELGNPANFYSFNNIVTICWLLSNNESPINIVDDFGIDNTLEIPEEGADYAVSSVQRLQDVTLGVWLVEENIYFTLTFTNIPSNDASNAITYTRSTPNQ